jgi:hypothetical protein
MAMSNADPPLRGRPPHYRDEFAAQAKKLCMLGATDFELAEFFCVTSRTIYLWKNSHPKFCRAVKVGKLRADERVERALFNRAVGYSYESEKVFHFQGEIVRAPIVEHVVPDPGAALNWLKNRKWKVWGDKAPSGPDGGPIPIITRIERVIVDPPKRDE